MALSIHLLLARSGFTVFRGCTGHQQSECPHFLWPLRIIIASSSIIPITWLKTRNRHSFKTNAILRPSKNDFNLVRKHKATGASQCNIQVAVLREVNHACCFEWCSTVIWSTRQWPWKRCLHLRTFVFFNPPVVVVYSANLISTQSDQAGERLGREVGLCPFIKKVSFVYWLIN